MKGLTKKGNLIPHAPTSAKKNNNNNSLGLFKTSSLIKASLGWEMPLPPECSSHASLLDQTCSSSTSEMPLPSTHSQTALVSSIYYPTSPSFLSLSLYEDSDKQEKRFISLAVLKKNHGQGEWILFPNLQVPLSKVTFYHNLFFFPLWNNHPNLCFL